MRLDIDARFLPAAIIIWISTLLTFSNRITILVVCSTTALFIVSFLSKFSTRFLLFYFVVFVAIISTQSRMSNKSIDVIAPGIPVNIEVKITSDMAKNRSRNIGIYREEDKFVFRAKTIRIEEDLINNAKGYDFKSQVQLEFSKIDSGIEFGSRLIVKGKLKKYDFGNIAYTLDVENYKILESSSYLNRTINRIRDNFLSQTNKLSGDAQQLLPGLILGDVRNQSDSLKQDMRNSGLTHLTAVSGGNIAILLLAIIWFSQKLKFNLKKQILIGLISLIFFAFLVRTEPSVVRASFMGAISLLGLFNGTRRHGLSALSLTICVSLLLDPFLAKSWGFSLSVFATAGLLLFTKRFADWISQKIPRIPNTLSILLAVALSAQVSTAALVAGFSGQITLMSVPANILVAPVIPFVTVLGYLALFFSNIFSPIAYLFALLASIFANWIGFIAHYFAAQNISIITVPKGILGFILVNTFLGLVYLLIFTNKRFSILNTFELGIILIIIAVCFLFLKNKDSKTWPITDWQFVMCDVGQGDGVVIRDNKGNTVVVDVGPDGKIMTSCLEQLKIEKIDVLILSHFHADHVEGLELVNNRYEIDKIYATWVEDPIYEVKKVKEILGSFKIQHMKAGELISIGDINIQCLWPNNEKIMVESIPNNSSVVNLITIKNASFLLTGDIEPPAQEAIRNLWKIPPVDIVKVPHHGSKFQDRKFPYWAGARLALVSAGKENSYGHPSSQAIDLYQDSGMKVLTTDVVGSIAIKVSDDDSIQVSTQD